MPRRRSIFVRTVGQLVARDAHSHHYWPESAPPDDPEKSQPCPQCRRLTWRYTAHCMHCGLDLRPWRLAMLLQSTWQTFASSLARMRR